MVPKAPPTIQNIGTLPTLYSKYPCAMAANVRGMISASILTPESMGLLLYTL